MKIIISLKFLILLLIYIGYVIVIIIEAKKIGIWINSLLKETFIVTLGVGLPMLFKAVNYQDGTRMIRDTLKGTLGISALIVSYVDLSSLSIIGELILQIVAGLTILLMAFNKNSEKFYSVNKTLIVLQSLIGFGMIIFTTDQLALSWNTLNSRDLIASFAVSIWLPLFILPFAYILGFFTAFELAMKMANDSGKPHNHGKRLAVAMFLGFHFRLKYASNFTGEWRSEISNMESFRSAIALMSRYRKSLEIPKINFRKTKAKKW